MYIYKLRNLDTELIQSVNFEYNFTTKPKQLLFLSNDKDPRII